MPVSEAPFTQCRWTRRKIYHCAMRVYSHRSSVCKCSHKCWLSAMCEWRPVIVVPLNLVIWEMLHKKMSSSYLFSTFPLLVKSMCQWLLCLENKLVHFQVSWFQKPGIKTLLRAVNSRETPCTKYGYIFWTFSVLSSLIRETLTYILMVEETVARHNTRERERQTDRQTDRQRKKDTHTHSENYCKFHSCEKVCPFVSFRLVESPTLLCMVFSCNTLSEITTRKLFEVGRIFTNSGSVQNIKEDPHMRKQYLNFHQQRRRFRFGVLSIPQDFPLFLAHSSSSHDAGRA